MKGPTERQKEILSFVSRFTSLHGYSPSQKEIGEELGISVPAVHYALLAMEKKGLLESGGIRAIRLPETIRDEMKNVPLPFFSQEPDEEELEKGAEDVLYLPSSLVKPSSLALLDKEEDAKNGDIVLAHPEGREGMMELRRLRKVRNLLELWPENDSMGITRSQSLRIYGILREIRRKY